MHSTAAVGVGDRERSSVALLGTQERTVPRSLLVGSVHVVSTLHAAAVAGSIEAGDGRSADQWSGLRRLHL